MCGIAGIVLHADYALEDSMERAARMRDAMTHRGPDDSGIFQEFENCQSYLLVVQVHGSRPTQPSILNWSVNEYRLRSGS